MIVSLRPARNQLRSHTVYLEWRGDSGNWQKIHYYNVKPAPELRVYGKNGVFREILNRVLAGEPVDVVASFHLETGELFIHGWA